MIRAPKLDSSREEARSLVDFLHKQAAYYRKHGGAALKHEADALGNAGALLDTYQAGVTLATPHPVAGAELICWTSVDVALPDAETTVMLVIDGADEVCTGFLGHDGWCDWDMEPIADPVRYWAHIPTGPMRLPSAAGQEAEA